MGTHHIRFAARISPGPWAFILWCCLLIGNADLDYLWFVFFRWDIWQMYLKVWLLLIYWSLAQSLTHWGRDAMAAISHADIFKYVLLNENIRISIKIPLKIVPEGPINNIPALVQIMAWRRPGDKPLFEPMMVGLLTHICISPPQWVKLNCFMISGRTIFAKLLLVKCHLASLMISELWFR